MLFRLIVPLTRVQWPSVINTVVITAAAKKDLAKAPAHVADKLEGWVRAVTVYSLEEVRKVPGYHDEPLKGARKGQRSIRLSKQWRAIYVIKGGKSCEFASVEEVTPHKY
jgi:toxin HigB-1